jgi:hypothetical protein
MSPMTSAERVAKHRRRLRRREQIQTTGLTRFRLIGLDTRIEAPAGGHSPRP